jgi:hypothetical protein
MINIDIIILRILAVESDSPSWGFILLTEKVHELYSSLSFTSALELGHVARM